MTASRRGGVPQLLRRLAQALERCADGDDRAMADLAHRLHEGGFDEDELQVAAAVLRSVAGLVPAATGPPALEAPPGRHAQRVPSAEERESVSPEAWGFLLDLKARGSLNPGQFERVLGLLLGSGVRPVDVDLAREAATHVALDDPRNVDGPEMPHGEEHLAH